MTIVRHINPTQPLTLDPGLAESWVNPGLALVILDFHLNLRIGSCSIWHGGTGWHGGTVWHGHGGLHRAS